MRYDPTLDWIEELTKRGWCLPTELSAKTEVCVGKVLKKKLKIDLKVDTSNEQRTGMDDKDTDWILTDRIQNNMLYRLMRYSVENYGHEGNPCVVCYNRKKVPRIAPVAWKIEECEEDLYCPFLCILHHMTKAPSNTKYAKSVGKKCVEIKWPEPGIGMPTLVEDTDKLQLVCFERTGRVKVGNMSARCENVLGVDEIFFYYVLDSLMADCTSI